MSLSDGVRGVIQNILGEKFDEAAIRDATYTTPSGTTGSSPAAAG